MASDFHVNLGCGEIDIIFGSSCSFTKPLLHIRFFFGWNYCILDDACYRIKFTLSLNGRISYIFSLLNYSCFVGCWWIEKGLTPHLNLTIFPGNKELCKSSPTQLEQSSGSSHFFAKSLSCDFLWNHNIDFETAFSCFLSKYLLYHVPILFLQHLVFFTSMLICIWSPVADSHGIYFRHLITGDLLFRYI